MNEEMRERERERESEREKERERERETKRELHGLVITTLNLFSFRTFTIRKLAFSRSAIGTVSAGEH